MRWREYLSVGKDTKSNGRKHFPYASRKVARTFHHTRIHHSAYNKNKKQKQKHSTYKVDEST